MHPDLRTPQQQESREQLERIETKVDLILSAIEEFLGTDLTKALEEPRNGDSTFAAGATGSQT